MPPSRPSSGSRTCYMAVWGSQSDGDPWHLLLLALALGSGGQDRVQRAALWKVAVHSA